MTVATYTPGPLPEYAGNPLIEALPPMVRQDDELLNSMAITPTFDVAERKLATAIRREMVLRLKELFVPLPPHFDLFDRLSSCLRRSYVWRNPLCPSTQAFLHRSAAPLTAQTMTARAASGSILFLKGVSGVGKSTGIEACLRALGPSVIRHEQYGTTLLLETQVVWLKISCPEDRSLKSLCIAILMAADAALGCEGLYAAEYLDDPRITTGGLVRGVMQFLANNHVGVLVVDELQNLFASKGQPAIELLNFLLRIRDDSGICLVLCGTYASLQLLQEKFRLGRRLVEGGVIELKRPAKGDDAEWTSFCEILWSYQWLSRPSRFTKRIAEELFDLTQGIRGVAVPLMIRAQEDAISSGVETITAESLRDTWNRHFSQLDTAMAALRSNDPRSLAQWDDLCDALVLASMSLPDAILRVPSTASASSAPAPTKAGKGKKAPPKIDPMLAKLSETNGLEELRAEGVVGLPKADEVLA